MWVRGPGEGLDGLIQRTVRFFARPHFDDHLDCSIGFDKTNLRPDAILLQFRSADLSGSSSRVSITTGGLRGSKGGMLEVVCAASMPSRSLNPAGFDCALPSVQTHVTLRNVMYEE